MKGPHTSANTKTLRNREAEYFNLWGKASMLMLHWEEWSREEGQEQQPRRRHAFLQWLLCHTKAQSDTASGRKRGQVVFRQAVWKTTSQNNTSAGEIVRKTPSCLLSPVYQTNPIGSSFPVFLGWIIWPLLATDLFQGNRSGNLWCGILWGQKWGKSWRPHGSKHEIQHEVLCLSCQSWGQGPGDRWGQKNLMRSVECVLYETSYYHTHIS